MPALLFGSEKLDPCRAEPCQTGDWQKDAENPKTLYNNVLPRVILQLPSIRVLVLIRKLGFLSHLLTSDDQTLGLTTMRTLASYV